MSLPLRLPIETIEHIIGFLSRDVHALATCSLVCRALLPACRANLWRDIIIPTSPKGLRHARVTSLLAILDANSVIAPYVRRLEMNVSGPLTVYEHTHPWHQSAVAICCRFPRLRMLRLYRFSGGLYDMISIAFKIPTLEALEIELPLPPPSAQPWPSTAPAPTSRPLTGTTPPDHPQNFALRALSVIEGDTSASDAQEMIAFLERNRAAIPLKSYGFFPKTWARGLHCLFGVPSFAPELHHFGISICDITPAGRVDANGRAHIQQLYQDLPRCRELRSLDLRYDCSGTVIYDIWCTPPPAPLPYFLDALADVFTTPGAIRFPSFERLSITIATPPSWLVTCETAFAHLARSLVGESAEKKPYPRFSHLAIRTESLANILAMMGDRGVEEAFVQQAEERERLIFPMLDCFLRAGISVEVELC